ncbi:MAG: 4-alpha-glucanotransferase, partial [Opitutales bacterium]
MRDASTVRFDWLTKRGGGVLLHPTSLPSPFGIGTLGGAAHAFLDFLAASNLGYWQILPLGPTGYGDSPYSAYSVFAGNHLLIDPGELLEHGLLRNEELAPLRELPTDRVDFGALTQIHRPLMR